MDPLGPWAHWTHGPIWTLGPPWAHWAHGPVGPMGPKGPWSHLGLGPPHWAHRAHGPIGPMVPLGPWDHWGLGRPWAHWGPLGPWACWVYGPLGALGLHGPLGLWAPWVSLGPWAPWTHGPIGPIWVLGSHARARACACARVRACAQPNNPRKLPNPTECPKYIENQQKTRKQADGATLNPKGPGNLANPATRRSPGDSSGSPKYYENPLEIVNATRLCKNKIGTLMQKAPSNPKGPGNASCPGNPRKLGNPQGCQTYNENQ